MLSLSERKIVAMILVCLLSVGTIFVLSDTNGLSALQSHIRDRTQLGFTVENLENITEIIWNKTWDAQYGGFYRFMSNGTVEDDDKDIHIQAIGLLTYALLYQITGNNTYLDRANLIMSVIEKMKD